MPEITFDSPWLKAKANVQHGDHIRFMDTGTQEQKGEKTQWVFNVGVIPQGQKSVVATKKFSLNKKNFKAVAAVYGTNSDAWEGKEMRVAIVRVQNPEGDIVPGIRLSAPGVVEDGVEEEPEDEDTI